MSGRRILALTTDGFGGRGGIAIYARDAIQAMAARPDVDEVVVIASLMPDNPGVLPKSVTLVDRSRAGKAGYAAEVARLAIRGGFDAVWIAHAALAPLGWLAARRSGSRLGMSLHGSEVWARGRWSREWAMARADLLMPVSQVTLERYLTARGERERPFMILPGAVDLARFTPAPKPVALMERYGLNGRRVLLTVSRIGEDHGDKGFARMFAALPALRNRFPDLIYVIVGDGPCRSAVEYAARAAGLADMVRFAGFVTEAEKPDHYRIADAFILPSTGEGLGIVLLEAQACGVPAIASSLDGGREAVDGMGWTIDPDEPGAIVRAVDGAFHKGRGRPEGLEHFSKINFTRRMTEATDILLGNRNH